MLSIIDRRQLEIAGRGYASLPAGATMSTEEFAEMMGVPPMVVWKLRRAEPGVFPAGIKEARRDDAGRGRERTVWPVEDVARYLEVWRAKKARADERKWAAHEAAKRLARNPELKPKPVRRKPAPIGRVVIFEGGELVLEREGYYSVYAGIECPPRVRIPNVPADIATHYKAMLRPWPFMQLGQCFFVAGKAREKLRYAPGTFQSRYGIMNGLPGTMIWKVK